MGGIDVLFYLEQAENHTRLHGGVPSEKTLGLVREGVAELIAALTAEREIRNNETKPSIDVERAAYERTDAALRAVSPGGEQHNARKPKETRDELLARIWRQP